MCFRGRGLLVRECSLPGCVCWLTTSDAVHLAVVVLVSWRGVGDIAILMDDEPGSLGSHGLDHQKLRRRKTKKWKYPPSHGRHRHHRQSSPDADASQGHVLAGVPAWRWDMKPDDNHFPSPSLSVPHTHPPLHSTPLVRKLWAGTSKAGFRMSRQRESKSTNTHSSTARATMRQCAFPGSSRRERPEDSSTRRDGPSLCESKSFTAARAADGRGRGGPVGGAAKSLTSC